MNKLFLLFTISLLLFSCKKTETTPNESKIDSTKIVDSINATRTKINDSIKNKSKFENLSGNHTFLHNGVSGKGQVTFKKVEGNHDEYDIKGEIRSGKNYATINGIGIRVSDKHFNFTGEISQSIQANDNGKTFTRKGTKTFLSKDGGKTWRLQDMINSSGFADYIDIKL